MKRNQKGFTLIELLAVIVILAIIALIATPMVLKYIEDARIESAERSTEATIKALETTYVASLLDSDPAKHMSVGNYYIGNAAPTVDGVDFTSAEQLTSIDVKNAPTSGGFVISEGEGTNPEDIKISAYDLVFGDYSCDYVDNAATCEQVKAAAEPEGE